MFENMTDKQRNVIFAALCAMVEDVHAPQDNLKEDDWQEATVMWKNIEELMNNK